MGHIFIFYRLRIVSNRTFPLHQCVVTEQTSPLLARYSSAKSVPIRPGLQEFTKKKVNGRCTPAEPLVEKREWYLEKNLTRINIWPSVVEQTDWLLAKLVRFKSNQTGLDRLVARNKTAISVPLLQFCHIPTTFAQHGNG